MIRRPPRSTRTDTFFPYTTLFRADPVRLLHEIRRGQERLATIADVTPQTAPPINDALDQFLTGLRIAWRDGELRPTAGAASKPKRERRRPDHLLSVTGERHDWFLAEPWRTGRELLDQFQAVHPGEHHDARLSTTKRR